MRLIDADALIERIEDDIKAIEDKEPVIAMGAIGVLNTIKKAPSVEQDRLKGEWIDYTEYGYVECPFCHSATNCDGNKDELHFCFLCGADMRGDAE